MYFDRFKYTRLGTSSSVGLFSNRRSNTEIIPTTKFNLSCDSGSDGSDNTFFIDRQLEKRKRKGAEIEDRIKTHHNNVLEIFRNWRAIPLRPLTALDHHYSACVPLYIDVVSLFQQYDRYGGEGASHLLDYTLQYGALLDIIRLQNRHNRTTSQFMTAREHAIREGISNNPGISIPEWRSDNDRYPWYKLAKIFEHFMAEAYQHKEIRIEDYTSYDGIEYHKLFRKQDDLIAVAEKEYLEHLRDLIDSEPTIGKFKELLEEINTMQNLLNSFGDGIGDILYYAPTNGLQGRCHVEQEIHVPAILRGPIMRFFRRRLLRNPPVP